MTQNYFLVTGLHLFPHQIKRRKISARPGYTKSSLPIPHRRLKRIRPGIIHSFFSFLSIAMKTKAVRLPYLGTSQQIFHYAVFDWIIYCRLSNQNQLHKLMNRKHVWNIGTCQTQKRGICFEPYDFYIKCPRCARIIHPSPIRFVYFGPPLETGLCGIHM